jgi:hypothetical protein
MNPYQLDRLAKQHTDDMRKNAAQSQVGPVRGGEGTPQAGRRWREWTTG